MATTVSSIVDQAEAIALSVLGSTWKKLRWTYDLEKNEGRVASSGYGIRPGAAEPVSGIIHNETLLQEFTLILSGDLTRVDSDDETQAVLDTLYDKADLVFKQFVLLKLNLSGTVLKVDERALEAPIKTKNNLVFLESRFQVMYRQTL